MKYTKMFMLLIALGISSTSFGRWTNFIQYLCLSKGSDYGFCLYEPSKPKDSTFPDVHISLSTILSSKLSIEKCQFRLKDLKENRIYYPNRVEYIGKNFGIYFVDTSLLTKDGVIYTSTKTTQLSLEGIEKKNFTAFKVYKSWVTNDQMANQPPSSSGTIDTKKLPDHDYLLQQNCE